MRRMSYGRLAGPHEICINPARAPLAYEELRLKEYVSECDGTRMDEIPHGNDRSSDAVRHAMMDDMLRGCVRIPLFLQRFVVSICWACKMRPLVVVLANIVYKARNTAKKDVEHQ